MVVPCVLILVPVAFVSIKNLAEPSVLNKIPAYEPEDKELTEITFPPVEVKLYVPQVSTVVLKFTWPLSKILNRLERLSVN